MIFSLCLLLSITKAMALQQSARGCIAVFQGTVPIKIKVQLPHFDDGIFQTKQFSFANLPSNMVPDANGDYCYPMVDDRFAYVQAYYYAVQEIEDYNQIFRELGLPLGKTLVWTLIKMPGMPTMGETGLTSGVINYSSPVLDPSILAHEVGHWVRFNAGNIPDNSKFNSYNSEGSADILGALHSGNTIFGKYDGAVESDVDTYIRFPDHVISSWQEAENLINNPIVQQRYPMLEALFQAGLDKAKKNPQEEYAMKHDLNSYASSAIITQPLWSAALIYGFDTIKKLYIFTASELNQPRSYCFNDFAKALVTNAYSFNPSLSDYLETQYRERGLFKENFTCEASPSISKFNMRHFIKTAMEKLK